MHAACWQHSLLSISPPAAPHRSHHLLHPLCKPCMISSRVHAPDACMSVQWNPWEAAGDCYKEFVCVENAKITKPVHLKPDDSWRGEQEISVVDLV